MKRLTTMSMRPRKAAIDAIVASSAQNHGQPLTLMKIAISAGLVMSATKVAARDRRRHSTASASRAAWPAGTIAPVLPSVSMRRRVVRTGGKSSVPGVLADRTYGRFRCARARSDAGDAHDQVRRAAAGRRRSGWRLVPRQAAGAELQLALALGTGPEDPQAVGHRRRVPG